MNTDIHTLAGAYALDALSDIEQAEFARHLRTCPACDAGVAELRETAARLGELSATAPPARLRDSVLAEASRTRQAAPASAGHRTAATGSRWRRWGTAAAAAILVAAGSGTAGYLLHHTQPPHVAAHGDPDRILAILRAPDARLTAWSPAGGGHVTVVTSKRLDEGVALVDRLPSPGRKAYQLWLIAGATPTSVGVMPAGATGGTQILTHTGGATAFGVSEEPPGGSSMPTQPLVTSFPLP